MESLSRRKFIKLASLTAVAAGGVALGVPRAAAARPQNATTMTAAGAGLARSYAGSDLSGWTTFLGDGLYAGAGQAPVTLDDLATTHRGADTLLEANVNRRGVMAHNICARRITDDAVVDYVHSGSFEFRLPVVPATNNPDHNAQTLEAAFFVWDGANKDKDLGIAFQWILNPWMPEFGSIRYWHQADGGSWRTGGFVAPDTEWHRMEFMFDPIKHSGSMSVDGSLVTTDVVSEQKPAWGDEKAARLQAEIISLFPGDQPTGPVHQAEFRNWSWDWTEPTSSKGNR